MISEKRAQGLCGPWASYVGFSGRAGTAGKEGTILLFPRDNHQSGGVVDPERTSADPPLSPHARRSLQYTGGGLQRRKILARILMRRAGVAVYG